MPAFPGGVTLAVEETAGIAKTDREYGNAGPRRFDGLQQRRADTTAAGAGVHDEFPHESSDNAVAERTQVTDQQAGLVTDVADEMVGLQGRSDVGCGIILRLTLVDGRHQFGVLGGAEGSIGFYVDHAGHGATPLRQDWPIPGR
ncbi:MAG: hypothetical protein V5A42_00555 [Halofilum sp. (in: g-proteobacteria)]